MKVVLYLLGVLTGVGLVLTISATLRTNPVNQAQPLNPSPTPRPLLSYRFEELATYQSKTTSFKWDEEITKTDDYRVIGFTYLSEDKTISGVSHQPLVQPVLGTVLLIRGYVPKAQYYPGAGSNPIAAYLATRGYQTFAPDFLGHGSSDPESNDPFEARVVRPVVVMDLLSALKHTYQLDSDQVGIWGHSNGGQIALSVLGITREPYPTVLWAPVTKPFPYSILFYTDEPPDYGKAMRKELAAFELLYDAEDYSLTQVVDHITAPVQLHQGQADTAVPVSWSRQFVEAYQASDSARPEIEYREYPGLDHNMRPGWSEVAAATWEFFERELR